MRRGPLIAAVAVVVLTALLAVVTNWATEIVTVPAWLADPTVIVLVAVTLVLLLAVAALVGGRTPQAATHAVPTFATVAPSLRPPPPGPVFGRDAELAALAAQHREPVLDVVCAGGGTGKSTLAREVARRHGNRSFWVDWRNDPDVLATSMVEVARTLGLPADAVATAQRTGASLPDLVWAHLESVRGWLVVVDNVDDVDALQAGPARIATYRGWLRPTAAGRLLVTTRLQDPDLWGPQARLHRIGRLPTADAAAVLRGYAPQGGDAAEELAERLGGHPLALRAAGRAVGSPTSAWPTFAAYLAALREQRISVLPDTPRDTDPETARRLVGHTWEVSLDQLAAKPETRLARPLLRALALLARAPVPRGLITPALLPEPASEQRVDDALDGLNRYGLLEPSAAPGTVLLHPLVRETSAAFLAQEADVTPWRVRVDDRVVAFVDQTVARERAGWSDARLLVPHVRGLSGLDGDADRFARHRDTADALTAQLQRSGSYHHELELRQRVLDAEVDRLGPLDPDTLSSRMSLAWAQMRIGDLVAAQSNALEAYEGAVARHAELVLRTRRVLAVTLIEGGRVTEAVGHLEAVHDAYQAAGGPDDPDTLVAAADLATALQLHGESARAAELHRRILEVRTRTLGPDDPGVLVSLTQLANALTGMRRHSEAAELHVRCLELSERIHGPDHPETQISRHNLALSQYHLGQHQDALVLARHALDVRERTLGPDHPSTVSTRRLVADCEDALRARSPLRRLRALHRR